MILVTGSNGQVGKELKQLASSFSMNIIFFDRQQLDITDANAVENIFQKYPIKYCINTAAYTAVDKAESEANLSFAINAEAVQTLVNECQKCGAYFIHFSSDYVYHNDINRPLLESDPTTPQGIYAKSKLAGDVYALTYEKSIVLRTSWVYSSFGHNFVKTMLRLGRERPSLSVVYDQIGTPTYACRLAEVTLFIIDKIENKEVQNVGGCYHLSSEGVCSWYDFARAIFEIENIDCSLTPILSVAYPTPAPRPHYSVLDKGKIKTTFGVSLHHWREDLADCLKKI